MGGGGGGEGHHVQLRLVLLPAAELRALWSSLHSAAKPPSSTLTAATVMTGPPTFDSFSIEAPAEAIMITRAPVKNDALLQAGDDDERHYAGKANKREGKKPSSLGRGL